MAVDAGWGGHPMSSSFPALTQDALHNSKRQKVLSAGGKALRASGLHHASWAVPSVSLELGCSIKQGGRPYQEDTYDQLSTSKLHMVGVYDGHGGAVTATLLKEHLLPALSTALEPVLARGGSANDVRAAMCAAIRDTFLLVNATLSSGECPVADGSTAAVLVLCEVQGRLLAFSANAGDSRVTLGAVSRVAPPRRRKAPPAPAAPAPSPLGLIGSDSSASSQHSDSDAEDDSSEDAACSGAGGGTEARPGARRPPGGVPPASFAVRLSRDHDLDGNAEEALRIRAAGGVLGRFERGGPLRVHSHAGGLNMGRSFGDVAYAGSVIADPFISVTPIAEPAEFIIVASDGLWGVMQDAEAAAYVHTLFQFNDLATRAGPGGGGATSLAAHGAGPLLRPRPAASPRSRLRSSCSTRPRSGGRRAALGSRTTPPWRSCALAGLKKDQCSSRQPGCVSGSAEGVGGEV